MSSSPGEGHFHIFRVREPSARSGRLFQGKVFTQVYFSEIYLLCSIRVWKFSEFSCCVFTQVNFLRPFNVLLFSQDIQFLNLCSYVLSGYIISKIFGFRRRSGCKRPGGTPPPIPGLQLDKILKYGAIRGSKTFLIKKRVNERDFNLFWRVSEESEWFHKISFLEICFFLEYIWNKYNRNNLVRQVF